MKKHAKKIVTVLLAMVLLIPTVAMLVSNAATGDPVELAFNNIFVFEKWANNSLSSTALFQGTPISGDDATEGGTLTKDIVNGSFTLTKTDMTAGTELYTAFSMNSTDAAGNEDYYMMDVEPNTSYTFTYNVSGTIYVFTPYVFMYTDEGLYHSNVPYGTPGYGINSFSFTTPSNVKYIQVRFTIGDNESAGNTSASSVYATVKDIAIYKTELYNSYLSSKNLFSLADWAANEATATSPSVDLGTITTDVDNGKITMVNSGTGYLWTGFGIDTANSNDQYYTMDVAASTSYTLTYDLVDQNLLGPIYLQPFIVEMDSDGKCLTYYPNQTASLSNKFAFTTQATTARIQLVFALITDGDNTASADSPRYCTIDNIGIYKSTDFTVSFETITGHPYRKTYEASTGTYGTLPEATAPAGMVFAGWYTAPNGSGERITADTAVSYGSYTVYAKYEPAVDTLTVKTKPTKLIYTVGEKLNPAGLVLTYGITTSEGTSTTDISTGYYCTPEYLNTVGTQTITVSYGGKTATFDVTVTEGDDRSIIVNNAAYGVTVANNKYTLDYTGSAFNRYEITYFSDAYTRGIITFDDDTTEEFFLEPSDNGHFASYIDNFLGNASHTGVKTISLTGLNKEFADIELLSLTTVNATVPTSSVQYYENEKYKVGIDLAYGGVISYIECLEGSTATDNTVVAAQYTDANGKTYTKVDYKDKLPAGAIATVESVNLINTNDRGRYLQQSYYGTDQPPFVMGDYNGVPWNYNPVQGGNLKSTITGNGEEASKVIDYRITESQIYVKTRPLDWGKNSIDYGQNKNDPAWNTPSYMEAWYTFTTDGKGLIQGSCRFVDYSGYPANTTTQEFPALYTVEPLNHFVYNNVTEDKAWAATQTDFADDDYLKTVADTQTIGNGAINIEEPEFWGVLPSYVQYAPNGNEIDPNVVANEHWAAFTASEDKDSFGIGIYSPGVSNIHYGCFIAKYEENQYKRAGEHGAEVDGGYIKALDAGTEASYTHEANFRHANTLDPATELHTSYIAPIETLTFESYTPITYTYYVSTGTADEIREDFRLAKTTEENAQKEVAKIAVPETVYMTPVADGATHTTIGQNYVNNTLNDYNIIETVAEAADKMYFGLYALDAKEFTVKVTNVTTPSNEIDFYNLSSSASAEGEIISCAESRYRADNTYGLRFTGTGLKHGEMATAKWEITVTLNDGTKETYTAYTVLYAPERTVGAVAEGRHNSDSQNEVSSWITGANGVDHSQRAPLGSFKGDYHDSGYFIEDPLVFTNPPTNATEQTEDDLIITSDTSGTTDDYSDTAYVLQTATNGEDDSRSQSYLGLLKIDKSRYSNTNQIPNLKIGYDALRVGSGAPKDSLSIYNTYYTLGTETAFTSTDLSATPSGWTTHESHSELAASQSIPYRTTVVPSYTVSDDLDGKYIHAIAYGKAYNLFGSNYATAGTSVLISITDKSELRDAVLDGYDVTDGTPLFNEKLKEAATVLGDPTASQEEIDNAKKELSDASKFALKYDNFFSALEFSQHTGNMTMSQANYSSVSYSEGALTVTNEAMTAGETYTKYGTTDDYYLIDLKPNTEYVFEYDVTTTLKSQAFLFFYNASGANSEPATNISVQTDRSGTWASKSESNSWIGNYQNGAGTKHYAIKFTTGATTTQVGFRFGNTDSSAVTSTFSNIRLIDSERYYSDATYSKTEAAYPKQSAYASLITPTRPGYTFVKWVDAAGNTVSASDVATNHLSVFSVWTEHSYTIVYNANSGSGTVANQTATYSQNVTLASSGYTKTDYALAGWSTDKNASTVQYQLGQTVSKLTDVDGATVTLYAVWEAPMNVTFDNLVDMMAWQNSDAFNGNANITDVTNTGFSVTNEAGGAEKTAESTYFEVTPGKQYKVDIDITGDNWDVYVFFCDSNGNWVDFSDGANRYSYGGGNVSQIFTAPNKTEVVKAKIRVDCNQKTTNHTVNFENIRVYEYDGISPIEVTPSNAYIPADSKFGTLPTPTKEGFEFLGWYDESGNQVTADSIVPDETDKLVPLTSKWKLADSSLGADAAVADFGAPISIDIDGNDTVFANAATAYGATGSILGLSTDGGTTYSSSVNGSYGTFTLKNDGTVTYAPNGIINGVDTVYYHAQLSKGDTTVFKNTISVVPASNVLYEETVLGLKGTSTYAWIPVGSASADNQDVSTENDCYGYDSTYNEVSEYSNGSARKVTVNSTNKRSDTLIFNFNGTGFDLMGSCGPTTGVQIVTVRNSSNQIARVIIVDTYYSDSSIISSGNLNQVPIACFSDAYDTYSVEVTAAYLNSAKALKASVVETYAIDGTDIKASSTVLTNDEIVAEMLAEIGMEELATEEIELIWMDDNSVLNGGTGAESADSEVSMYATTTLDNYVDSVRVYNPINDQSAYNEKEYGAVYYNVVNNLADTENGVLTSTGGIFAYLEGSIFNGSSFADYTTNGPKNELYLSNYMVNDELKGVTFDVTLPEGARVMLGVRAASGAPYLKVNGTAFAIGSSTEMYYDITQYISAVDGVATITLANSGTGLLAINNMKLVGAAVAPVSAYSLERSVALMSLEPEVVEYSIPVISQPEPDESLPETDDTLPEAGADGESTVDENKCWLEIVIEKICSFFSDVFGYIKWIFELIISFITTKEVF